MDGFIVLFSVILSILEQSKIINILAASLFPILKILGVNFDFAVPIASGIIELTNGLKYVSSIACKNISFNIIITSFLLGFGGISIFFQVYSIVSKTDLSIKPYLLGKILQGIFSCIYTYIFIKQFRIFNLDLQAVFSPFENSVSADSYKNLNNIFLLLLMTLILFIIFKNKHPKLSK